MTLTHVRHFMESVKASTRNGSLLILVLLLVVGSACNSVVGGDDDGDEEYREIDRLRIQFIDVAGNRYRFLWTNETGWDIEADSDTTPAVYYPDYYQFAPIMFDEEGNEIVLGEDSEFEVRYAVENPSQQNAIYFDSSGRVEIENEEVELFYGDRVRIYMRNIGTAQVRFLLWKNDQAVDETDPIDLTVETDTTVTIGQSTLMR